MGLGETVRMGMGESGIGNWKVRGTEVNSDLTNNEYIRTIQ